MSTMPAGEALFRLLISQLWDLAKDNPVALERLKAIGAIPEELIQQSGARAQEMLEEAELVEAPAEGGLRH